MYLIDDASVEERQHAGECAACQEKIARLAMPLEQFRGAVRNWTEQAGARDRAVDQRWTVMVPPAHEERLRLLPALDVPWYRSVWSNLRDLVKPLPPLDVTSKPVLVKNIWGQYGRQKKSWVLSLTLQSAVVAALFTVALTPTVQRHMGTFIPLVAPDLTPPEQPPVASKRPEGSGGGGDRSPLAASKGRLPKAALKQFTPPMAVVRNLDPKLTMEPSIVAPPDARLPDVNVANYGDPLAKLGPLSNGPGCCGGIGSGKGAGVGPGLGDSYGPGIGGVGGGVYRVGGGVTAPTLVTKVEPEYSEEARKAKYQGVVLLHVEVDPSGRARNIRVLSSLGLGLDEKAIAAVEKWKFRPGTKDGKPVTVVAQVEVRFRLL